MPYTFGAGTDSNVVFTGQAPTTIVQTSRTSLYTGWYFPTTLTAGRYLVGYQGTTGIKIDTTTTDLRVVADYATTDGELTAPAGLTVNDWHFIAWLTSWGASGTTNAHRLWVANGVKGMLTERTLTSQVAPAGALTSGSTTLTIGNVTAATAAFQGDISNFTFWVDANATANITLGAFGGTIPQDTADMVARRLVEPIWRGDYSDVYRATRMLRSPTGNGFTHMGSFDHSVGGGLFYLGNDSPRAGKGTGTNVSASTAIPPRFMDDVGFPPMDASRLSRRYAQDRG